MDLKIKGKYALVTGASRGIGRHIALALASEGCNVAICARDIERVQQTVEEIKAKGVQSIGFKADVTRLDDIIKGMDQVIGTWGTLHILVNNAGGGGLRYTGNYEEASEELWSEAMNLNAMAAVRFMRFAVPHMRKQKWGRVVTLTSKQGKEGGGRPWYNMAKASEVSLMKTFAMNYEASREGVTFNSVAPGAVLTEEGNWADLLRDNPARYKEHCEKNLPMGRLGTPEEIANVVTFLCSEQASLLTGACIPVDGAESKAF